MTPQERQLIDDLFDRLAKLENAPRDPEAMSAIMQGLRKAPNAVYALVQTALVQDEALKRANDRIQELEAGHAAASRPIRRLPRFDARRGLRAEPGARFGLGAQRARARHGGGRPAWNSGQVLQQTQPPGQYGQPGYGQAYGGQPYGGSNRPRSAAAVAARSSEPRRRPRPAWSADRCCSAASAG